MSEVYDDENYASIVKEMKTELAKLRQKYKDDGEVVEVIGRIV